MATKSSSLGKTLPPIEWPPEREPLTGIRAMELPPDSAWQEWDAATEKLSGGVTCHDPDACAAGQRPCPTPALCRCAA